MQKIKVWIQQDIAGTYFVYGTYNLSVSSNTPYSYSETLFKSELDNLFPHLSLSKIKIKIKQIARKYKFIPVIKEV